MRIRRFVPLGAVRPDINITPLVDIVLVLLIIFMLVMPRMDQDVAVELPGIVNADSPIENALDPLKVTVAKPGEYYINGRQYDLDGAMSYLSAAHAQQPSRRLALGADAQLTYGQVRALFARCQHIGFPGVSLLVSERPAGGSPQAQ